MSDEVQVKQKSKTGLLIVILLLILLAAGAAFAVIILPQQATAKKVSKQLYLGERYLEELDYEEAIAAYEKAIKIDPKCTEAYLALAEIYEEMGDYEMAEEILDEAQDEIEAEDELDRVSRRRKMLLKKVDEEPESEKKPTKKPEKEVTKKPEKEPTPEEEPTKAPTKKPIPTPSPSPTPTQTPWLTEPVATPTPVATKIPDRDLGGMDIIIGDHWTPEYPPEPTNAKEELTLKYRQDIMKKYNFTIQSRTVAGWGEMEDTCITSISKGDPVAQIFELDYRFVATPLANGLFYDLATLSEFDFTEKKWNKLVLDIMTKGDSVYGMRAYPSEPRGGVIFNKRLFEEAGLNPDLLYDLQASGEWTWSKFEEICARLTRDKNNDGVTDVYATVSQGGMTMRILAMSAGADLVERDRNGKLYNNTTSREVINALNFAVELYNKGYEMPQPEGSDWDYFVSAFREGKAAMQFAEEYNCQPGNNYGDQMRDEVGFVMPPKPDGAENYCSYVCDNIAIIPACYDSETASRIAFAYNVYTMPTPGYDGPNDWLEEYYAHFNDERAVRETIVHFNDGVSVKYLKETLVEGLDDFMGPDLLWHYPFYSATPADVVAGFKDAWDAIIAEANK